MKLCIPLAVVAATLIMPATALASNSPVAGCPASKELLTIADTLQEVDKRIYEDLEALAALVESVDSNGDGYLCIKRYEPNRGQDKFWGADDYMLLQVSDNKPSGRTPS